MSSKITQGILIRKFFFKFFVLCCAFFVLADASGVLCFVIVDYAERQRWGHFLMMGNSYGVFCA
jgi:uncharacterized membrane protein